MPKLGVKTKITRKTNTSLRDNLTELLDSKVKVLAGVPADAVPYPGGTPVVEVAIKNEFGIGVPERSFVRSTFKENQNEYKERSIKAVKVALKGDKPLRRSMSILGSDVSSDIKRKIVDIKEPPNAPLTIALKGSSNPLIDTGHMKNSVTYEVRDK